MYVCMYVCMYVFILLKKKEKIKRKKNKFRKYKYQDIIDDSSPLILGYGTTITLRVLNVILKTSRVKRGRQHFVKP